MVQQGKERAEEMRFCGIYRCKQCGSVFSANELKNLQYETVRGLFSSTNENNAAKCVKVTMEMIVHRCDPVTVGVCEQIGWVKYK